MSAITPITSEAQLEPVGNKTSVGPEIPPNETTGLAIMKPVPAWPLLTDEPTVPKFHKAGHDFWYPNYEAAVLSAMLNYPDRLNNITAELSSEHFYDEHNQLLFHSILQVHNDGKLPSPETVQGQLAVTEPGAAKEWLEYIEAMAAVAIDPRHIKGYAAKLEAAVRIRGGGSYCVHEWSEAFCAELLQLRVGNTLCIGEQWLSYEHGVWVDKERNSFRRLARECIHPYQRQSRRINDVVGNVESALQASGSSFTGAYKFSNDCVLINAANCVIIISPEGQIECCDHSPDDRFTATLAAEYESEAKCPLFEQTLAQALPDSDDRVLLQRFGGYILYPGCEFEAALSVIGPGETGKSTIAMAMRSPLGKQSCTSMSLEDLCSSSSYALPNLKHKLLNLASELNANEVNASSNFKALVSGEYLNTRQIYKPREEMRTTAKLIFLTNHVPRFKAGTDAERRRMRMLLFNTVPQVKDTQLKYRLRAEKAGILNWMLQGLVDLRKTNEIPQGGRASREIYRNFSQSNDPIGEFVRECCEMDPGAKVAKQSLLEGYCEWCELCGIVIDADKVDAMFFRMLRNRMPQLTYTRERNARKAGDGRTRFVRGLRLSRQKADPFVWEAAQSNASLNGASAYWQKYGAIKQASRRPRRTALVQATGTCREKLPRRDCARVLPSATEVL